MPKREAAVEGRKALCEEKTGVHYLCYSAGCGGAKVVGVFLSAKYPEVYWSSRVELEVVGVPWGDEEEGFGGVRARVQSGAHSACDAVRCGELKFPHGSNTPCGKLGGIPTCRVWGWGQLSLGVSLGKAPQFT